jgi:predicted amidohydrolase YtcJ
VNSRALELAGITAATGDPADGRIERDASGGPSGTLHEGAMELVRRILPDPAIDELVRGLELAQAYLHRLGVTAWQDAWVTPRELEAYRLLAGRGQLTGRAIACQWWERDRGGEQIDEMVERRAGAAIGRLRATTVKIMQDGVAENYTAAMLEPYLDVDGRPTSNRGLSFVDPEALKGHVSRLDAEGFQVHFHALGDRAVREALDAVEAARRTNGPTDGRPHLAHLQVVDPADLPRFASLVAAANIQPYWACHDAQMVDLTLPFLPPARAALQYPFESLRRAGARLVGGSDWSVSTPNVMAEVEVAVNRSSPEDRTAAPFLPAEALSLTDALAAFTNGSAWINHLEDSTGSIEVGKLADLAVLDRDLYATDRRTIGDARVLLTLVEGEVVHEDPGLERA